MTHIWRKQIIGIGLESTAGTAVAVDYFLPKMSGDLLPEVEYAEDNSWYGVIDQNFDREVVKESSKLDIEWMVRDESFWMLLHGVFWTTAITGTGDYTHTFTRANTNTHPTFTVWQTDPVATYKSAYSMIDTFTVTTEVGDYVKYTASFMGNKMVSDSAPSVSWDNDNEFLAKHVTVKLASTEAWLAWASETELEFVNISFAKNVIAFQKAGSVDTDSRHNQSFSVTWSIRGLFANETLLNLVKWGTKRFMQIAMVNTDVTLAWSGNPSLTFTLANCVFENFQREGDNDSLIKESMDFTAHYSLGDWYTAKAVLINERSTAYDA